MYDQLILAPMDAYNEAMRLYWQEVLGSGVWRWQGVSLYPNFYLNDKAAYYMGNSYKNLYERNSSFGLQERT